MPHPDINACRRLLDDLRPAHAAVYFRDTALSAGVGWLLFALAAGTALPWPVRAFALVGSALLLYRALAFIHELFHQQGMSSYRHFWHAVAGVPLLLPLLLYLPIHQGHHAKGVYGTVGDGEYEHFAGRRSAMVLRLFALNLLLPLALVVRFAVLTPLALVFPVVRREVIPSFVHLSLRMPFRAPEMKGPAASEALRVEAACSAFSWLLIGAACFGAIGVVLWWFALLVVIATLNTVRALGSTHLYVEHADGRDAWAQVADSLNVAPGGWMTTLLCPGGLQYHALHHLAPYLPYHALPEAHARLLQFLPEDSAYRTSTVTSMMGGWRRLVAATQADDASARPAQPRR